MASSSHSHFVHPTVDDRTSFLKERALRSITQFFSQLGGCRFRDARQTIQEHTIEIDAALITGIWQVWLALLAPNLIQSRFLVFFFAVH
jgi:hypothetical protein